jgi:hypothetical protein
MAQKVTKVILGNWLFTEDTHNNTESVVSVELV